MGFAFVLIASILFCVQNVIVRVLFAEQTLFGLVTTGGFVPPNLQHSFLLMFMRMFWVVPILAVLSPKLHPPTWKDLRQLPTRPALLNMTIAGGVLMFAYIALFYLSVGLINTGVGITLFFSYPVFTALMSWIWFGDRPSGRRWLVMGGVIVGTALTVPWSGHGGHTQFEPVSLALGVLCALASGVTYAAYTVIAQKSFEQFHPIPYTWLSFTITLALSGLSLLWLRPAANLDWTALWIGGGLSAAFSCTGHVLNNLGIRLMGATASAIVAAANPALTVVLAWFAIQERLDGLQISGVMLVTISIILLAREKRIQPASEGDRRPGNPEG